MEVEHATDSPVASPRHKSSPMASRQPGGDLRRYRWRRRGGLSGQASHRRAKAGILVIHEWWGLNDNIRSMARQLAGEGYLALAVDLYEGEVAETREDAGRLARGQS